MASPSRLAPDRRVFTAVALLAVLLAPPAHALRLMSYNILNYPGSSGPARAPYYRTILAPLHADVIVTGEMASPTSATEFLNEVLNVMEPGQWASVPFVDGNDTDAACFYRISSVQFLGQWSFYPNPANLLRLVHVYRIKPAGYTSAAAELRLYAAHLKASDTSGDAAQRLAEVTGMRDSMNAMPAGTRAFALGDFNFYRSSEAGYQKFFESQSNNIGRLYDVLPAGSWHDGASYAPIHTQSPCKTTPCASGAATGGMDDRFDFILPTLNLGVRQGLALALPDSMVPVGNDGLHLNLNITDNPVIPQGADYATALKMASDHLPVRVDLQVPARISTDSWIAFGSVIVGAPAQSRDLTVSNPAVAPADSLHCTFAVPDGFGAPGPLVVAPGGSLATTVTMDADSVGSWLGNVTITSNSVDEPTRQVGLSGMVLRHAQPSLDSLEAVVDDTLDLGDHLAGGFMPVLAAVHDLGYDALCARLRVGTAQITGGDGRFSIADFSPVLVAGTAARWSVQFDDADATPDSTYRATLTFTNADEPLPGDSVRADVRYLLRAHVVSAPVAVEPAPPAFTRLYAPMPNPLTAGSTLRFDLAHPTRARLEVFDLSGRRVASLTDREFAPGRYNLRWDGRGESGGALGSGLYFVRLTTRGLQPQTVRLAVVR